MTSPIRLLVAGALVMAVPCPVAPVSADDSPTVIASHDDAFIAHDAGSDLWTIGSSEFSLVVGFDPARALSLRGASNPVSGRTWDITPGPDVSLSIAGERVTLGGGVVSFVGADAQGDADGVRLVFTFEHRATGLRVSRAYACYPGSPTIETWTTIDGSNLSASIALSDLVGWRITMPASTVKWLGGLRGDTADNEQTGAFVLASGDLEEGDRLEIGGDRRSSEQDVPFVMVDAGPDEFYGGVMWSGGWRIAVERVADDRLTATAYFPGVETSLSRGRSLEVPHTFFGVTSLDSAGRSGALQQFILRGIRHGRPLEPLVTYNTWFAYGATITQDAAADEMQRAAAMGVELFVLDAGWYVGAGAQGDYDYTSGLGTWAVVRDRFPDNLSALSDNAHGGGMKFGLWVEPERVALGTVNRPTLAREEWLAKHDGSYGSETSAQICLVHPAARRWVLDRLAALIESAHPDYLKWDNNFWINCNRSGHGQTDGNFAHVQALYGLLDELRARYPDLLIENASGGGNRLDFGMLARTDAGWMDDRTTPSSHVRHNLEGLSAVFPPAYLLSFVDITQPEPIGGGYDLPLMIRSRMPGILGLTHRNADFDDSQTPDVIGEIVHYKRYRDVIARASATLLSNQAPVDEWSWDVLQEVADDRQSAIIFAFKSDPSGGRTLVRPRNLDGDTKYAVYSLDAGFLGTALGDALMLDGIELVHDSGSAAHILTLRARP